MTRPGSVTNPDVFAKRRTESRSGSVSYGSDSNRSRIEARIERPTIVRAPVRVEPDRRLAESVYRQERSLVVQGHRQGYYHHNRRWRDDYFYYPHYRFTPWVGERCYPSPWYYYSYLPPYLSSSRVIYVSTFPVVSWNSWSVWRPGWNWDRSWAYTYDSGRYAGRPDYNDVDAAVEDIIRAFRSNSLRSLDRLVPSRGNVNIYLDNRYAYSLSPNDFYDLMLDGIENSRTRAYRIVDVRWSGSRFVRVSAEHEYLDAWGSLNRTYHTYLLEQERGDYVIREFGSSQYR
jgi:hypothetical protein